LNFTLTTAAGDIDLLGEMIGVGGYEDLRTGINSAVSLETLRELIAEFFGVGPTTRRAANDSVLTTLD
jgi:hypothetical protein